MTAGDFDENAPTRGEREAINAEQVANAALALYDAAQIDGCTWTFRFNDDAAVQMEFFRLVNAWRPITRHLARVDREGDMAVSVGPLPAAPPAPVAAPEDVLVAVERAMLATFPVEHDTNATARAAIGLTIKALRAALAGCAADAAGEEGEYVDARVCILPDDERMIDYGRCVEMVRLLAAPRPAAEAP